MKWTKGKVIKWQIFSMVAWHQLTYNIDEACTAAEWLLQYNQSIM